MEAEANLSCRFDWSISNGNTSCLLQNEWVAMDVATHSKKIKQRQLCAFNEKTFALQVGENCISCILPIRTISEGNCFEHWKKKHARHKQQRRAVLLALGPHRDKLRLPCTVTLTRYAPRKLDAKDNLPMSFKYLSDSVADVLVPGKAAGRADDDERINWKFDQVKSKKYFININIEFT